MGQRRLIFPTPAALPSNMGSCLILKDSCLQFTGFLQLGHPDTEQKFCCVLTSRPISKQLRKLDPDSDSPGSTRVGNIFTCAKQTTMETSQGYVIHKINIIPLPGFMANQKTEMMEIYQEKQSMQWADRNGGLFSTSECVFSWRLRRHFLNEWGGDHQSVSVCTNIRAHTQHACAHAHKRARTHQEKI